MGLETRSGGNTIYLSVAFGQFRRKTINGSKVNAESICDISGSKSVCRKDKDGNDSWALEYPALSGTISKIFLKEGDYGDSFEVVISDGADTFQISFKTNSRFWTILAKRLPNVIFSEKVRISVWDYETTEKRKIGLNIEQDNNPNTSEFALKSGEVLHNVNSYYEQWNDKVCTHLHELPNVDWKDKDQREIDLKQTEIFFKKEFKERFEGKFDVKERNMVDDISESQKPQSETNLPDNNPEDDLPF